MLSVSSERTLPDPEPCGRGSLQSHICSKTQLLGDSHFFACSDAQLTELSNHRHVVEAHESVQNTVQWWSSYESIIWTLVFWITRQFNIKLGTRVTEPSSKLLTSIQILDRLFIFWLTDQVASASVFKIGLIIFWILSCNKYFSR